MQNKIFQDKLILLIQDLAGKQQSIQKIVVFGGRARGDFHEKSNYDLCLFGNVNVHELNQFLEELEKLPTAKSFDVLQFIHINNDLLKEKISKDRVIIYQTDVFENKK